MITDHFLRLRPLFVLAGLLLLGGSGLMWVYAADSDVPLVQVTKTVDKDAQKAGKTVQFTVTVRNDGDDATVTLVDTMPTGMTLLPDTVDAPESFIGGVTISESADSDMLTWEGRMFGNSEVMITYEAQIDETAQVDDILTNRAVVTSSDGTTTTASASVTVNDDPPFVFLPMLHWAGYPGLCYQEQNNVIVLDLTRQAPNGWEYIVDSGAIIEGFYRWPAGHDVVQPAGEGILEYIIRIDNPGRYYMRMHSLTTHPHLGTEANDIWMNMESDGKGWEKVVTWAYQAKRWGWAAGREIHTSGVLETVQNPPSWDFPTAGEYTFQLSARSGQYGVDRMAFYQSDALGFSEPADHQGNSSVRNEIDNTLDDVPTSELCVGYVPPSFDR